MVDVDEFTEIPCPLNFDFPNETFVFCPQKMPPQNPLQSEKSLTYR